jgi:hypothetical protein
MADVVKGKGKASKQEGLKVAFDRAWDDAKSQGGGPGTYTVEKIEVECDNPIRAYVVTIQGP